MQGQGFENKTDKVNHLFVRFLKTETHLSIPSSDLSMTASESKPISYRYDPYGSIIHSPLGGTSPLPAFARNVNLTCIGVFGKGRGGMSFTLPFYAADLF